MTRLLGAQLYTKVASEMYWLRQFQRGENNTAYAMAISQTIPGDGWEM
jgi:hypothetical protein